MKHLTHLTLILLFGTLSFSSVQAAQFYVTALTPTLTANDFTALYRVDNAPAAKVDLYTWIGEDGKNFPTWKRDNFVVTLKPDTEMPYNFGLQFDFTTLNLVAGKVYSYVLADRTAVDGAIFFNTPGSSVRACFTITAGSVACGTGGGAATSGTLDSSITSGESHNTTSGESSTTSGTIDTSSGTWNNTSRPQSITTSGMTLDFQDGQSIFKDYAQITGNVSVALAMPVDLSYTWGREGMPLTDEHQILKLKELSPGTVFPVVLSFPKLDPGTTYSFAIKNKVTGATQTRSFTTPDKNQPAPAQLAVNPDSNSQYDPGGFTPVDDTISDKGIVPRCGRTAGPGVPVEETYMCTYKDFLQLISNIIQYAIIIVGPIIAIIVMYTGAMIIWLGRDGDPTAEIMKELKEHKARLVRIAIGILIMLSSYMIVATILRELGVDPSYILLDLIG